MAHGGGGGGGSDIWWFVGLLVVFFILWVSGGGPQRAEEQGLGEVKVGQKYNNQDKRWTPDQEEKTPTSTANPTPSDAPKYSGNGQIIY